jgi:hypothetical protein
MLKKDINGKFGEILEENESDITDMNNAKHFSHNYDTNNE